MKNELVKVLVVLGFALTFFLSCADNDAPPYPDINHFLSSSSRPSVPSLTPSSSSISIPVSSFVPSSSSSRPSSSSKPSSSSSVPSSSSSSVVPSSSSVVWSDDTFNGISGTFTDVRDNLTYKWVEIGTQIWMAENLKYDTTGSVYHKDDTEHSCGRLYDWATAMGYNKNCNEEICNSNSTPPHQGMCPAGWHLPVKTEWETLINFSDSDASLTALKLKATNGWHSKNGTNELGFAALPCGAYDLSSTTSNGGYLYYGNQGFWWTATETIQTAYDFYMHSDNYKTLSQNLPKGKNHFSIRCVKDK